MPRPHCLSLEEITAAFQDAAVRDRFPPLLTLSQFADLFQVSLRTAKAWIGRGDFNGATTRIGKHRRIWRDRAVAIAFSREHTRARTANPPRDKGDNQIENEQPM